MFLSTNIFPVFQFEEKEGLGTNIPELITRFIGAHVNEDGCSLHGLFLPRLQL